MSLFGEKDKKLDEAYELLNEYLEESGDRNEAIEKVMMCVAWALREYKK